MGSAPSMIVVSYLGFYGALGVYAPFLALYLERRGLARDTTAYLLAAIPIIGMLAAPAWTVLADYRRSAVSVVRFASVGAFVALALIELRVPTAVFAIFLLAFAAFRAPISPLLDTLGLAWARRTGGNFGRLRAWGTVGYTLSAFAVGALIDRAGPRIVVHVTVVLLAASAVGAFALREDPPPPRAPLLPAIAVLGRRPRYVALLASSALHQIGLSAYEVLFPSYFAELASALYAGSAVALGAATEVAFMVYAQKLAGRGAPERLLVLAYAGSFVRWLVLATVREPHVLVAAQALNALSFGAFFVSAVTIVDQESPEPVRASSQGLFGALIWGLARGLSLALAGAIRSRWGMPSVFYVASVGSVLATFIALGAPRGRLHATR